MAEKKEMFSAIMDGKVQRVEEILTSHPGSIHWIGDFNGSTPFLSAVGFGNVKMAQILFAAKSDIHVTDKQRNTPLHKACDKGYVEIVKMLISANADVNATAMGGTTPLHNASSGSTVSMSYRGKVISENNGVNRDLEVIKLLLSANVDINVKDNGGSTPLHTASNFNQPDIVKHLLSEKADINAKDQGGNTPLFIASLRGHLGVVKELLSYSEVDVHAKNKEGKKPGEVFLTDKPTEEIEKLLNEERKKRPENRDALIKCRFGNENKTFLCKKTTTLEEFIGLVQKRWGEGIVLQFKDNQGELVGMKNTEDLMRIYENYEKRPVRLFVVDKTAPTSSNFNLILGVVVLFLAWAIFSRS